MSGASHAAPTPPGIPGAERCRLVLVRHGEPACAVAGIVGGPRGDTGLTERGRDQVRAVAARLAASRELGEVAALYASTLPRAIETAELLAPALGRSPQVRAELREQDPGELDGWRWADVVAQARWPDFEADPHATIAERGESLASFHDRARAALRDLAARHGGETVVVACHGGIVAAAVGLCFALPAERRVLLPTAYASMTEVALTPARCELVRYNDRYPLVADQ